MKTMYIDTKFHTLLFEFAFASAFKLCVLLSSTATTIKFFVAITFYTPRHNYILVCVYCYSLHPFRSIAQVIAAPTKIKLAKNAHGSASPQKNAIAPQSANNSIRLFIVSFFIAHSFLNIRTRLQLQSLLLRKQLLL